MQEHDMLYRVLQLPPRVSLQLGNRLPGAQQHTKFRNIKTPHLIPKLNNLVKPASDFFLLG
ncbi:hypothetical protein Hanom_Chr00s000083g01619241 [Helianthus anomalus]